MTTFDTLIERNQDVAAHHFPKDLPLMPTLRAMVIDCVDRASIRRTSSVSNPERSTRAYCASSF